ncbi:MAG: histidinol-phosphate aminotransferase [Halanaerobiales bacterium]|nr:histidinol-phosphate aminotransferase [Halanaerobiales bacterium]
MYKYLSTLARNVTPYVPGEQPGNREFIKLNTNENPYPPSPEVIRAIKGAADESLRLYPDPECEELREVIAGYYGLSREEVFVGNGSDELLAFSFQAFFDPGRPILFPDITYTFYQVYSSLFRIDYELVPLNNDLSIPVEGFFRENGGVIFPNPNAPTGRYLETELIAEVLEYNPDVVVIIDEAYIDFGGKSVAGLIKDYPNLLVIQTFSKSRSLAGLRVGFAMGQQGLIEGLNRIKNSINSYTLDRLAIAGAIAAIKDEEYFQETRRKIINTRERVSSELTGLGFEVIPSKTNFIFITHPEHRADKLFSLLREKGILVRYFNQPRITNFLRVSIGSEKEMDHFLERLQEIL